MVRHDDENYWFVCYWLARPCCGSHRSSFYCSTSRMLQMASLGSKPKILVSSGSRSVLEGQQDVGVLALRTPADLINLLQVIMKLDARTSFDALHTAGTFVLEQAHARRFGKQSITVSGIKFLENGVETGITVPENDIHLNATTGTEDKATAETSPPNEATDKPEEEDGDGEDGFLAF